MDADGSILVLQLGKEEVPQVFALKVH